MTLAIEILESEIMRLPLVERTSLLNRLMQSISRDSDWEASVDAEAATRALAYDQGTLEGLTREQSEARMQARFPR